MESREYEQLLVVISGTKAQIQEVSAEINDINAQVIDPVRMSSMNGYDYQQWKSKAIHARGHLMKEAGRLKNNLTDYNRQEAAMRQEAAQQRKQEAIRRRKEIEAEHTRKLAVLGEKADVLLMRRLYGALCRMYQIAQTEPTPMDKETLDLAHAFLIASGAFEE